MTLTLTLEMHKGESAANALRKLAMARWTANEGVVADDITITVVFLTPKQPSPKPSLALGLYPTRLFCSLSRLVKKTLYSVHLCSAPIQFNTDPAGIDVHVSSCNCPDAVVRCVVCQVPTLLDTIWLRFCCFDGDPSDGCCRWGWRLFRRIRGSVVSVITRPLHGTQAAMPAAHGLATGPGSGAIRTCTARATARATGLINVNTRTYMRIGTREDRYSAGTSTALTCTSEAAPATPAPHAHAHMPAAAIQDQSKAALHAAVNPGRPVVGAPRWR